MSKHVKPSSLWRREATNGWVDVTICAECHLRGFHMDVSCLSPCSECGSRSLSKDVGKWAGGQWVLRSETKKAAPAAVVPDYKNPLHADYDPLRVLREAAKGESA